MDLWTIVKLGLKGGQGFLGGGGGVPDGVPLKKCVCKYAKVMH